MRGRRGTFATYIEVCGSPATNRDTCGAAAFCVASVTLSAPEVRFAWQAWYFRCLHKGLRKLGDALGRIGAAALSVEPGTFNTSGSMCVAGVALSVPPYMSAEAWRRTGSDWRRGILRGRRDAFRTSIDVRGSLATNWVGLAPRHFTWQAWRFQHLKLDLCGRRDTFSTSIDVGGSLATIWVGLVPRHFTWQA